MNAKKRYLPVAVLAAALVIFCGCEQQLGTKSRVSPVGKNGKIAVILDTDICDDIDDTWALAMLLQSPEFDIKLITTAVGDTTARTKVVATVSALARPQVGARATLLERDPDGVEEEPDRDSHEREDRGRPEDESGRRPPGAFPRRRRRDDRHSSCSVRACSHHVSTTRSVGGTTWSRPAARAIAARNVSRSTFSTAPSPSNPANANRSCSGDPNPARLRSSASIAPAEHVVRRRVHLVGQGLPSRRGLGHLQQETGREDALARKALAVDRLDPGELGDRRHGRGSSGRVMRGEAIVRSDVSHAPRSAPGPVRPAGPRRPPIERPPDGGGRGGDGWIQTSFSVRRETAAGRRASRTSARSSGCLAAHSRTSIRRPPRRGATDREVKGG